MTHKSNPRWRDEMLMSAIQTHINRSSPEVKAAARDLARAGPDNYTRPCQADPARWDVVTGAESVQQATARVREVEEICLGCKVFVQCHALATAVRQERRPSVVGIIAGTLIDTGKTAAQVHEAIANGADADREKGQAA